MHTLTGKVALITGGARGIGKAIALKLAQAGCNIIVVYYNSSDEAAVVCDTITQLGCKAMALQANVADATSVKEMIEQATAEFKRLDIIISNAASGVLKPAMKLNVKHWRWCLETNALALLNLIQPAKEFMPKGSRVIALSSLGASRAIPNYAFIGASKAALEAMVRSLSLELAPDGISINTVSAGLVDTDALKHFPDRELLLNYSKDHTLINRILVPEDVANAVYLLCLPEAEMIKGQTIFVDAGYTIIA